jgi:hypothetical protein
MKYALIFSKQHEPYEDVGTSEEFTGLERALSEAQKPPSMRLLQNTSQIIKLMLQKNKFVHATWIYKMF